MKGLTTDDVDVLRDIFWKMYQEHTTQTRHLETQRSTIASIFLVLAGSLATVIGLNKGIDKDDFPLALLIIILGITGFVFSKVLYKRTRMHIKIGKHYRDAIDELIPNIDFDEQRDYFKRRIEFKVLTNEDKENYKPIRLLRRTAEKYHDEKYNDEQGYFSQAIHQWWAILYIIITIVGIILTYKTF